MRNCRAPVPNNPHLLKETDAHAVAPARSFGDCCRDCRPGVWMDSALGDGGADANIVTDNSQVDDGEYGDAGADTDVVTDDAQIDGESGDSGVDDGSAADQ